MVDLTQAYHILKGLSTEPLEAIYESEKEYTAQTGIDGRRFSVDKGSGEVKYEPFDWIGFWIEKIDKWKEMYCPELFDDYMEYYKSNKSEQVLARLYKEAYNNSFYCDSNGQSISYYNSSEDLCKIKENWKKIEQTLYKDIREILDDEDIKYPQCVVDKWDDPFYRIKPFMVRNGYTDNGSNKTWVEL